MLRENATTMLTNTGKVYNEISFINILFFLNLILIINFISNNSIYKYILLGMINFIILVVYLPYFKKVYFDSFLKELFGFIMLYILYSTISAFLGINSYNSLKVVIRHLILFWILFSYHIWMYNDSTRIVNLLKTFIFISTMVTFSIIVELIYNNINILARYGGIVSNLNNAGYILAFGIISISLLESHTKKKYTFIKLINLFSLILTGSRSGLLFLGIVTCLKIIQKKKFKLNKIIMYMGLFFLLSMIIIIKFDYLFYDLFRMGRGTAGRSHLWKASYYMWSDYKLWGVGLGNFAELLPEYLAKTNVTNWEYQLLKVMNSSHSMVIDSFVQSGIVGGVILISVMLKTLITIKKVDLSNKIKQPIISKEVIIAITIGVFLRTFFEPFGFLNHGYIAIDIFYWLFFIAYQNQEDKTYV